MLELTINDIISFFQARITEGLDLLHQKVFISIPCAFVLL